MAKPETQTSSNPQTRPPVVVVMGHVDHGKTTLLDTIRKANVAAKEFGAITQHIGAYQVTIPGKDASQKITFIDTPGHAAFSAMRARGVTVADIAILVVAADDSVKPQTVEAINHIKQAGIPMIVAINKVDLPTADVNKVKADLATHEVYVEGYGGNIVVAEVAAKTGKGVPELLEMIGLVAELEELTADPQASVRAVVIESRVDKGRGPVATVIVQQGTMQVSKDYYVEGKKFRVRSLVDEYGKALKEAGPATPCEILGLTDVPGVGAIVTEEAQETQQTQLQQSGRIGLEGLFQKNQDEVAVLLKCDVAGSMEAITGELEKLSVGETQSKLKILRAQTGEITESDVQFAKAAKAIILGFNVRIAAQARSVAEIEGVPYKIYTLIYELLDDIALLLETGVVLDKPKPKGEAVVVALFPAENKLIAGVTVTEGRLRLGETVAVLRNEQSLGTAKIKTMRHVKEDVKEISKGMEAGIVLDPEIAIAVDDVVQYSP